MNNKEKIVKFLTQMSEQGNRLTASPYFYVIREKFQRGDVEFFTESGLYYDVDGKKITTVKEQKRSWNNRVVGLDHTKDGKMISTILLGISHGEINGKPIIFETMVFSDDENFQEDYSDRYCTKEEAIEGHENVCKMYGVEKCKN